MPWNSSLSTRSAGFSVTATEWNKLINNLNFLAEVNYTAYTADVTINTTTVGTAVQVVTSGSITYENVPHLLEFYCPVYNAPAQETRVIVRDSTTVIGTLARVGASAASAPLLLSYRFTPSAASHSYNIAAWLGGAGTGTMNAGTGGTAGDSSTDLAGFIRITRIPT